MSTSIEKTENGVRPHLSDYAEEKFNDNLVRPAGDRALQLVAKTLRDETRGEDFVARYGGEGFAAVLPETEENGAVVAIKSGRSLTLCPALPLQQQNSPTTGRWTLPQSVLLIERAGVALYHSKENGRNQVPHCSRIRVPAETV